ncbi:MAG: hypothetical protein JNL62_19855, partial [Bryobacterales bacterium]|nr:hypothetical protein [Bryobacterales bacterium]
KYPHEAYEWDNFRLVCSRMNGRKGDHGDVLDPFALPPQTFDLNVLSGEVFVHRNCPPSHRAAAQTTIDRLGLNSPEVCLDRQEYITRTLTSEWSRALAERSCPFLVQCLVEQGLL